MTFDVLFFFIVGGLAIASAVVMITRPNPVMSVLFLIVNFFCIAILYLLLQAQFIAIIQILVYAGAIMVLFLFVIMLLNVGEEKKRQERWGLTKVLALGLGGVSFFQLMIGIGVSVSNPSPPISPMALQIGTVEGIGRVLFTQYLLPFEITSILLLAAMVGVLVLAKKKFR